MPTNADFPAVAALAAALSELPPSERPALSSLELACLRVAGFDRLVNEARFARA